MCCIKNYENQMSFPLTDALLDVKFDAFNLFIIYGKNKIKYKYAAFRTWGKLANEIHIVLLMHDI